MRGRGSGVEFDRRASTVVDFRGDRLLRLAICLSEAEALARAGALPGDPPA